MQKIIQFPHFLSLQSYLNKRGFVSLKYPPNDCIVKNSHFVHENKIFFNCKIIFVERDGLFFNGNFYENAWLIKSLKFFETLDDAMKNLKQGEYVKFSKNVQDEFIFGWYVPNLFPFKIVDEISNDKALFNYIEKDDFETSDSDENFDSDDDLSDFNSFTEQM